MDLKEIADFAEEIAIESGKILLEGFRSPETKVSFKSRTDLLTNKDKESEDYLFNAVKNKFPDHSIVAEEGSRRYAKGDFIWYIDPLDATNNYAHGIPFFCVSIGVYSAEMKKVVAGVVNDAYHNELFKAVSGSGSFLNGEQIHVSRVDDLGVSILATGFPYEKSNSGSNNSAEFCSFLTCVQCIRRLGSAALDLSYVASGRFDGFWEPRLKPWDMTAGSLIVEEAGGRVSAYDGSLFDPEFPEILASNGLIHEDMIRILKGA